MDPTGSARRVTFHSTQARHPIRPLSPKGPRNRVPRGSLTKPYSAHDDTRSFPSLFHGIMEIDKNTHIAEPIFQKTTLQDFIHGSSPPIDVVETPLLPASHSKPVHSRNISPNLSKSSNLRSKTAPSPISGLRSNPKPIALLRAVRRTSSPKRKNMKVTTSDSRCRVTSFLCTKSSKTVASSASRLWKGIFRVAPSNKLSSTSVAKHIPVSDNALWRASLSLSTSSSEKPRQASTTFPFRIVKKSHPMDSNDPSDGYFITHEMFLDKPNHSSTKRSSMSTRQCNSSTSTVKGGSQYSCSDTSYRSSNSRRLSCYDVDGFDEATKEAARIAKQLSKRWKFEPVIRS